MAYSNVLKEILNDDHRNTQTDEKMKADTTRKPNRRLFLNGFKILSMKVHEMIFPKSKIEEQKQTFTFNSIPEIFSLAGAVE